MLLTGELSIAASLKRLMDVHRDLFNLAKESLVLGVSYPYYQIAQRIHKAMDLVEMPDTKSHSYRTGFQHESPVHPQLITDGFRYLDSLWQLIMEDVKALRNSELLEWLAESPTAEFLRKSREAMNAGDLVTIEDMLAEHR